MSEIRVVYRDAAPDFPASDQHPDAVRYGPLALPDGAIVFVDALGGEPEIAEVAALLQPPAPPQPASPAADADTVVPAGITLGELKALLARLSA